MPESVKKLVALQASVSVESGAGLGAARTDDEYLEAGAEIRITAMTCSPTRTFGYVNRPSTEESRGSRAVQLCWAFFALSTNRRRCNRRWRTADHVCDGNDSAHHARAGDGRTVFDGHGGGYKAVQRRRSNSQNVSMLMTARGQSRQRASLCSARCCRIASHRYCAASRRSCGSL